MTQYRICETVNPRPGDGDKTSLILNVLKIGPIVMLAICSYSCGSGIGGASCPNLISGEPSTSNATSVWGVSDIGDLGKVSATITGVAVECTPANHPAVEDKGARRPAYTDYQIAVTATVVYKIHDPKWLSRQGTGYMAPGDMIKFEALSEKGVVLGAGSGRFNVVGGATENTETVSGTIVGISDTQIQRVNRVIAKWTYGR